LIYALRMPRTRVERDARIIREMEERRLRVEEEKRRLAEKDRRKAEEELPYVLLLLENFRCGKIPIDPYDIIDNPETYGSIWVRAAKMLIEDKSFRSVISEISVVDEVTLTNVLIDVVDVCTPVLIYSVFDVNVDFGLTLIEFIMVDEMVTLTNVLIDVVSPITVYSCIDVVIEECGLSPVNYYDDCYGSLVYYDDYIGKPDYYYVDCLEQDSYCDSEYNLAHNTEFSSCYDSLEVICDNMEQDIARRVYEFFKKT